MEQQLIQVPVEKSGRSEARPSRTAPLFIVAASVLLCCSCFILYTRYNNFPIHYHRDEPSKAEQIIRNTRNYNHPQLMLEVTEVATKWLGTPMRLQAVVEVGRGVCAAFASLAVVALALTAWRVAGWRGFVLTGLAAALCPALLVNAHSMKEETALVLGMCLTLLASRLFWDARKPVPRVLSLVFLGFSCGVAVSGKYAGLYATLAVLPLVLLARPRKWYTPTLHGLIFALALLVTVLVINHRIFQNLHTFQQSVQREVKYGTHGHGGQSLALPNAFHAFSLVKQTPPHILLLSAGYLILICITARKGNGWKFFAAAFVVGYSIVLCFCAIDLFRYVLSVVLMLHLLAAVAVLRFADLCGDRRKLNHVLPAGFAVLVLCSQLPNCLDTLRQFKNDSRSRLREWIARNVPAGAGVAQDPSVGLLRPGRPLAARVVQTSGSVSELGELSKLPGQGISFIAVDDGDYGRYFDPLWVRSPEFRNQYQWRRQWYEQLFRDHELVWSSPPRYPIYGDGTMTEIRLYRLRQ